MTPYEFSIVVRGFSLRKEHEAKEYETKLQNERALLVEQAFLISRWMWQKKIKQQDIEKILKVDTKPAKEMTNEQMLARVKALNALFGGEVKTVGEK